MQVLRYFPITPRLQHVYRRSTLSALQTWHAEVRSIDGVMRYHQDSPAWKHINETWPDFADEPRNVRMGLAIDGVNPYKQRRKPNSIWPVLLINQNIPPWLAMKKGHVMLLAIIPGPEACKNPDVYLAPAIEELVALWEEGVDGVDVTRSNEEGRHFKLRAMITHVTTDGPGKSMSHDTVYYKSVSF
jgi:Transposase family tnp2